MNQYEQLGRLIIEILEETNTKVDEVEAEGCLLYTSPSPRDS